MRQARLCGLIVLLTLTRPLAADEKDEQARLDRKVYDALRELHNQGADIYNNNELEGAYRYFQATLKFARQMLAHRPSLQQLIDDGISSAERQPTIAKRTFAMHLLIERVRDQLRGEEKPKAERVEAQPQRNEPRRMPQPEGPEKINSFPRELPPIKIDGPFLPPPPKKREDPLMSLSNGVGGRLLYRGRYLPGVAVVYVSRDQPRLLTFEAISDENGYYRLEEATPGKYTVLLEATSISPIKVLPERYRMVTTTSFIVDTRAGGEVVDIVLQ